MNPRYKSLYTALQKSYQDATEISMTLFKENRQQQAMISRLMADVVGLTEANKKMEAAIDKQLAANLKTAEKALKAPPSSPVKS